MNAPTLPPRSVSEANLRILAAVARPHAIDLLAAVQKAGDFAYLNGLERELRGTLSRVTIQDMLREMRDLGLLDSETATRRGTVVRNHRISDYGLLVLGAVASLPEDAGRSDPDRRRRSDAPLQHASEQVQVARVRPRTRLERLEVPARTPEERETSRAGEWRREAGQAGRAEPGSPRRRGRARQSTGLKGEGERAKSPGFPEARPPTSPAEKRAPGNAPEKAAKAGPEDTDQTEGGAERRRAGRKGPVPAREARRGRGE